MVHLIKFILIQVKVGDETYTIDDNFTLSSPVITTLVNGVQQTFQVIWFIYKIIAYPVRKSIRCVSVMGNSHSNIFLFNTVVVNVPLARRTKCWSYQTSVPRNSGMCFLC